MKEKEAIGVEILPQRKIERKFPGRERRGWSPSPWNKKNIPDEEKPTPIMMCKRCKHPR